LPRSPRELQTSPAPWTARVGAAYDGLRISFDRPFAGMNARVLPVSNARSATVGARPWGALSAEPVFPLNTPARGDSPWLRWRGSGRLTLAAPHASMDEREPVGAAASAAGPCARCIRP
jgi:hypothetical protein